MNFTVIVPSRNRFRQLVFLLNRLDIAAKIYRYKIQVICVDNSSTDFLYSIIKNVFKPQYISFDIIVEEKIGPSYARNTGISKAKFQHIIFTDDDCIVPNNFFLSYKKAWDRFPRSAVIGGRVEVEKKSKTPLTIRERLMLNDHNWCFAYLNLKSDKFLQIGESLFTANVSVDSNKLQENLYFNENLGKKLPSGEMVFSEDFEFCQRLLFSRYRLTYIHNIVVKNIVEDSRFSIVYLLQRYLSLSMEQYIYAKIPNLNLNSSNLSESDSHNLLSGRYLIKYLKKNVFDIFNQLNQLRTNPYLVATLVRRWLIRINNLNISF